VTDVVSLIKRGIKLMRLSAWLGVALMTGAVGG
jgi:hypothetical protein